jgi:hypothetical protein
MNAKVKVYKTIILQVVWYGCETWSFTLMENHRLRVFEKRVLRRIFGPMKYQETGECWSNEEIHILYSFPLIIRQIKPIRMRWAVHMARIGGREMCARF